MSSAVCLKFVSFLRALARSWLTWVNAVNFEARSRLDATGVEQLAGRRHDAIPRRTRRTPPRNDLRPTRSRQRYDTPIPATDHSLTCTGSGPPVSQRCLDPGAGAPHAFGHQVHDLRGRKPGDAGGGPLGRRPRQCRMANRHRTRAQRRSDGATDLRTSRLTCEFADTPPAKLPGEGGLSRYPFTSVDGGHGAHRLCP
jgi:hypothetical protein